MRRITTELLTAVGLALTIGICGLAQQSDEGLSAGLKDGFRDLRWGDPPARDMTPGGKLHGLDTYVRREVPTVAGREPTFIAYGFYKNRFCEAIVAWNTKAVRTELDRLVSVLIPVWGQPYQTEPNGGRGWLSCDMRTIALLRRQDDSNAVTLCGKTAFPECVFEDHSQ